VPRNQVDNQNGVTTTFCEYYIVHGLRTDRLVMCSVRCTCYCIYIKPKGDRCEGDGEDTTTANGGVSKRTGRVGMRGKEAVVERIGTAD
jgi:hypothetical protein